VVSTFAEDLPHSDFADDPSQYCVATATEKAVEVYVKLVEQDPDDPPSLYARALASKAA
jgi:septum formation protein